MPKKIIAITTGDLRGIGYEVTARSLEQIGPQNGFLFLIFSGKKNIPSLRKKIERKFTIYSYSSVAAAFADNQRWKRDARAVIEIKSSLSPALWVEEAANLTLSGVCSAIVTGPLSKPEILSAGLKDIGHTDILKRLSKKKSAWMTFWGDKFNVILATAHIELALVSKVLTSDLIMGTILTAHETWGSNRKKPLALLGLNPHAGDGGILGDFENAVLAPCLEKAKKLGVFVNGPLVPDVAFLPTEWRKYSAYICCYHDQGLIPFKTVHGFRGVHMTAGLPFIRTSVDHGTAFDLFGKNKADPSSMLAAIRTACRLVKKEGV